jgi:hypothetical protein
MQYSTIVCHSYRHPKHVVNEELKWLKHFVAVVTEIYILYETIKVYGKLEQLMLRCKTSEFAAALKSRFPCFKLHYAWESKNLHRAIIIKYVQYERPCWITLRATSRWRVVFTDLVISKTMVNEYKGKTHKCESSSENSDITTP